MPAHGPFIWPLGGSAVADEMNTSFGPRIDADRWDFHDGIDLPAATGTPVHAMASGVVHRAGPADKTHDGLGFGSTHVVLRVVDPTDGVDDLYLVYLHLDSIAGGGMQSVDWLTRFYFGSENGEEGGIARAGGLKRIVAERLGDIDARGINSIPLTGIEGVVVRQCPSTGCWFYLRDGAGKELKVEMGDTVPKLPARKGKGAAVEGRLIPYGERFEFVGTAVEFSR